MTDSVTSHLQASMPDDKELECAPSKRKLLQWTPLAFLNSLGHSTGFSTSKAINKEKVIQDRISGNCQQLGLPHPAPARVQRPRMHVRSHCY
jgi:hypothetical protein